MGLAVDVAHDGPFSDSRVERLAPSVDDAAIERPQDAWACGVAIGIASWLGIGDLHHCNVRLLRRDGRLTLALLDVEVIFNDFSLPSETLLISRATRNDPGAGLAHALDSIPAEGRAELALALALALAYVSTIDALENQNAEFHRSIAAAVSDHPMVAYARILPRATKEYAQFLTENVLPSVPFDDCESEQLRRGDIPYFLRFVNDSTIYWLSADDELVPATLPPEMLARLQARFLILSIGRSIAARRRSTLRAAGALQLLAAMGPYPSGTYVAWGASLSVRGPTIQLLTPTLRVSNEVHTCR
jgi:hypothetical protein